MKMTEEQLIVSKLDSNAKVNAGAGSGKTTTIIEFVKNKDPKSKILYLVFNKSAKEDAQSKFLKRGVYNVQIETAHSLAYSVIVRGRGYKVNHNDYKAQDLVEMLSINITDPENNANFIIATHLKKMMSMYCNSAIVKLSDLDYISTLINPKARGIVSRHIDYLIEKFKEYWTLMDKKKIEITHDFYLKKYQLSKPVLNMDYICFDEGQDSSEVMLDIFSKQKAIKIIVGDTHQQIYSWRYAVNSLDKMDYDTYYLSNSFRFGRGIAALANSVLGLKQILCPGIEIKPINGLGEFDTHKTHAVIARTNITLLIKAIEYCGKSNDIERVFFEGNLSSYTYASEGTSLYDVLNLFLNKRSYIKDPFIRDEISSFSELEEFVESVEDGSTKMLIDIVKEYGASIPVIIKQIKEKNVQLKEEAQIIFTTVHKSKGIEYDSVEICNDFITESAIRKLINDKSPDELNNISAGIQEEINMLYVALTRSKNKLYIPKQLIPENTPIIGNIFPLNSFSSNDLKNEAKVWTELDDKIIKNMLRIKKTQKQIAYSLKRSVPNVALRISELDL